MNAPHRCHATRCSDRTPDQQVTKRTTGTEYDDLNRRVRVVRDGKLGTVSHFNQVGELYLARENADSATSPITAAGTEGIRTVTVERTVSGAAHCTLASNPHVPPSSDSEPTMGWTLQEFDQAGRVKGTSYYRGKDKPPLGTNTNLTGRMSYSYDGNTTTVTELGGASRATTVDALGRMQSASEGGLSAATYVYDALDNVTGHNLHPLRYHAILRLISQIRFWTYGDECVAGNPQAG